jgi:hypothetical protein
LPRLPAGMARNDIQGTTIYIETVRNVGYRFPAE